MDILPLDYRDIKFLKKIAPNIDVTIKMPVIRIKGNTERDGNVNKLLESTFKDNHSSGLDCIVMFEWIMKKGWNYVLELGVWQGHSTIPLLIAMWLNNGFLHSIDIRNDSIRVDEWLHKAHTEFLKKYWKFTKADSMVLDVKDRFDMVYLDTSHKYEDTVAELNKFSKVTDYIFCHDYKLKPVKDAVIRFVQESGWHLKEFLTPVGLCLVSKAQSRLE